MSCTITITGATLNSSTGDITVEGHYSETQSCGSMPTIVVTVQCGPTTFTGTGDQLPGAALWNATFPAPCACDLPTTITVYASCPGVPPASSFSCTATLTTNNLCCCPQINTQVTPGPCAGNNQLATFSTTVTNNTACAFTIRRAFGDGALGSVFTIGANSTLTLPPEQNNYAAPGTYTSTFDVLSPPPLSACSGLDPVIFTPSCGACSSTPTIASLCLLLELLFLFGITAGLSIGLSQPCISTGLVPVFLGGGILAMAFYLLLQCQNCSCDFWTKDWGIILIATGFVSLMFVPPGCATITSFQAFLNFIVLLTLGALVLVAWYNNNKVTCSLIICDPWCAVSGIFNPRSAVNIALLVILLIYGLSAGALNAGFLLALLVVISVAVYIWTAGPLSNVPCKHTPTCQ